MSDNYPSIAIALQEIGDSILKSKATFGTPATLAETHTGLLEAYLRGVGSGGRPLVSLDSYALDALNALSILATSPRKEAFHALAAAGILGAAHVIAVEARQAGSERQEAPEERQEPASPEQRRCPRCSTLEGMECPDVRAGASICPEYAARAEMEMPIPQDLAAAQTYDAADDLLDTAKATATERESFRADMGRPSTLLGAQNWLPSLIVEPGVIPCQGEAPGTIVYEQRNPERALIGYVSVQGTYVEMRHLMDKPGYDEVVKKLAETERSLSETYEALKAS